VAAGLLALVYSRALQLGRSIAVPDAFELARRACDPLNAPRKCVGHGLLDCLAAARAIGELPT
jgi:hypothetical protein